MINRTFSRLSAAMQAVREQQETVISTQMLEVFFIIAAQEGISSSDIQKKTGIPQASVSRSLGDLGEEAKRKQTEGLMLVRTERDVNDRRQVLCFLTPKGKLLAARLARVMGADSSEVDELLKNGAQ